MAAKPVELYSGVDSVRAATELARATQARRDAWPYPHVYPPPGSEDVFVIATAAVGAQGAAAFQVLKYPVQSGKRFYLQGLLFGYSGAGFTPGDAQFTVQRNSGGTNNPQFLPEHGLVNVPVLLGGQVNGSFVEPWVLARAREFEPLDIVRITAKNVNLVGGQFVCGVFGYDLPVLQVKPGR